MAKTLLFFLWDETFYHLEYAPARLDSLLALVDHAVNRRRRKFFDNARDLFPFINARIDLFGFRFLFGHCYFFDAPP